jgi:hypothetical protein
MLAGQGEMSGPTRLPEFGFDGLPVRPGSPRFMLPVTTLANDVDQEPTWRRVKPTLVICRSGSGGPDRPLVKRTLCFGSLWRLLTRITSASPDAIDKWSSIGFPTMFALFNVGCFYRVLGS